MAIKKHYIEIDSAAKIAKDYVLAHTTNDALTLQAINGIKGSYTEAEAKLYREYGELTQQGKTAQADAKANALAYLMLQYDVAQAKKSPGATELADKGFAHYREAGIDEGRKYAEEESKQAKRDAERAREQAEEARKAARSPAQQAFEEFVPQADRAAVNALVTKFRGRTTSETKVNINNDAADNNDRTHQIALRYLQRAVQLEKEHGPSTAERVTTAAVSAVVGGPAAAAERPAANAPAAKAPAAAPKAPAAAPKAANDDHPPAAPSSDWTPIDKQAQYDLALLGKNTGQKADWKITDGVSAMDGKNGHFTKIAIGEWLAAHPKFKEFNAEAQAELHREAEAVKAQVLARAAAAPARDAGAAPSTGGGVAPAAGPAAAKANQR